MTKEELILEVLETLREMDDAVDVIVDLNVDAVIEKMESEE